MDHSLARRLIAIPLALVVTAVAVWLLLPFVVSTTLVRGAVEREIRDIVGRPVTIGEAPRVSLFPAPVATLKNVVVRLPSEDGETVLARIDTVETEMTIGSILRGQPRFSRIHLGGPSIYLSERARPVSAEEVPLQNVAAALRHIRAQPGLLAADGDGGQPNAAALVAGLPDTIRRDVGSFTFEDGTISFTDEEALPLVTELSGRFEWPRLGASALLAAEFNVRGRRFEIEANSAAPLLTLAGGVAQGSGSVQSDLLSFSFDGTSGFAGGLIADGTVGFETSSLSEVLTWARRRIGPGRAVGSVSLTGPVKLQANKLRFENLQIDVDGNSGTGLLELVLRPDLTPLLSGTLDFAALDLRAFLSAFVPLPADFDTERVVDLAFMGQVATDLRISASTASFGELQMTNLAATAQTTDELAIFDIGDAEAYGGNVQARLRFDRQGDAKDGEVLVAGRGIDTGALAEHVQLPGIFPIATGDISLSLMSPLDRWPDFVRRGSGTLSMQLTDGVLPGFTPAALAAVRENTNFQALDGAAGGNESFSQMAVEGVIEGGIMTLQSAELSFSETAAIAINGLVALPTKSLALTATLSEAAGSGAQRLFIGGSWNNPFATPVLSPSSPQIAN